MPYGRAPYGRGLHGKRILVTIDPDDLRPTTVVLEIDVRERGMAVLVSERSVVITITPIRQAIHVVERGITTTVVERDQDLVAEEGLSLAPEGGLP